MRERWGGERERERGSQGNEEESEGKIKSRDRGVSNYGAVV